MKRMRMGEDTIEDRRLINNHYVAPKEDFPTDPDTATACTTNLEWDAVEFMTWKNYLTSNHPKVSSNQLPPDNVLFIEYSIIHKKNSQLIHDISHSRLGDNDMRATDYSCKGAKISPVLRCYPGSHHMVNINDELKDKKVGNGSQCKCKSVKLKDGARREWKNLDGYKVYTVSIDDVKYVEFIHYPEPPKGVSSIFRLKPKTFLATIASLSHQITKEERSNLEI